MKPGNQELTALSPTNYHRQGLGESPRKYRSARHGKPINWSIATIRLWATAAKFLGLGRRSAHARRFDCHVGKGHRSGKLCLRDRQFFDRATLPQAFYQAVERPDIIRVLRTPLNSAAQAQIVATDLLGRFVTPLLGQQGR
jgi:hypothetical protein